VITIRRATGEDAEFLQHMLAIAADWRDNVARPATEVMADPHVARYIADWPRAGDVGFVAEDRGATLGAAWYRTFARQDAGYGFVDEQTPELSIGVVRHARGRGVGGALLRALIDEAQRSGVPALSLSVEVDNPAASLYRRVGFEEVSASGGASTMVLLLVSDTDSVPTVP
jgi:ribosomal protein S18 acetylase RimI-like enzyme